MLQAGRSQVRVPMRWIFSIYLILPASNRNKYQKSSGGGGGGKGGLVRKADNLTTICQLTV
jgi:hypothetical protein